MDGYLPLFGGDSVVVIGEVELPEGVGHAVAILAVEGLFYAREEQFGGLEGLVAGLLFVFHDD